MLCDVNIFNNLMKHYGQKCDPPQESILKPVIQTFVDRVTIIYYKIYILYEILK